MNSDRVKQIVRKVILEADAAPERKKKLYEGTTSETLINYVFMYVDRLITQVKRTKNAKLSQAIKEDLETAFHQTLYLGMLIYRTERDFAGAKIPTPQSTIEYRNHVILGLANETTAMSSIPSEALSVVDIISDSLYTRLRTDSKLDSLSAELRHSIKTKLTSALWTVVWGYYIQDTFSKTKV